MTNPAEPGPDQAVPARRSAALPVAATLSLAVAGGLAVGGSFGLLEKESEQAGSQTLTLSYTSWRLVQGGNYPTRIYFHAPHFGYPLVATGVLVVIGGLLLMTGHVRIAAPLAATAAGLLVGTVWTMGMVVSADLDAVDRTVGFQLTWTSGIGFWLVLAAGIAAAIGGILALLTLRAAEPPVPAPLKPSPRPREPPSPPTIAISAPEGTSSPQPVAEGTPSPQPAAGETSPPQPAAEGTSSLQPAAGERRDRDGGNLSVSSRTDGVIPGPGD